jgi:hypothetical protein
MIEYRNMNYKEAEGRLIAIMENRTDIEKDGLTPDQLFKMLYDYDMPQLQRRPAGNRIRYYNILARHAAKTKLKRLVRRVRVSYAPVPTGRNDSNEKMPENTRLMELKDSNRAGDYRLYLRDRVQGLAGYQHQYHLVEHYNSYIAGDNDRKRIRKRKFFGWKYIHVIPAKNGELLFPRIEKLDKFIDALNRIIEKRMEAQNVPYEERVARIDEVEAWYENNEGRARTLIRELRRRNMARARKQKEGRLKK